MTSVAPVGALTPDAPAPLAATGARPRPFRRLVASPLGLAAVACVLLALVTAVVAPLLWTGAAAAYHPDAILQPPSATYWAGTDNGGRDIFLRVLVASRLSLGLALAATAIGVVLGVAVGSLPALFPRCTRTVTSVVSTAVAFPSLLLAIFVATVVGVGAGGAVAALGLAGVPWFARLTQNLLASVSGRDFVQASRILGVGRLRILTRHLLPHVAEPLAVNATIGAGANLLAFAGLSYLGLGVQGPSYDWGRLLLEGVNLVYVNPAAALAPGVAIVLAGLALNLAGELAAQVLGGRAPLPRRARRVPAAGSTPSGAPIPAVAEPAVPAGSATAVLEVRGLAVRFPGADGGTEPVHDVDLVVAPGESVGVVGESGSGKSLTAMAVTRLLEEPATVRAATIRYDGHELAGASRRSVRRWIGDAVPVVFQDPMSALNPVMRVGAQLAEVARTHGGATRSAAWTAAVGRLDAVRIPSPERRARQLPHEYSGGMRQRAVIAMGLMGTPKLVVADEPTTALDVTVQREVLQRLQDVRAATGAALLLISHDIAVVAGMCDRVVVMYAGRVVEEVAAAALVEDASHPYTRALVAALPAMDTPRDLPLPTVPGRPPAPDAAVVGCAFAPRCGSVGDRCLTETPRLQRTPHGRVACWHPHERAATVVAEPAVPSGAR